MIGHGKWNQSEQWYDDDDDDNDNGDGDDDDDGN